MRIGQLSHRTGVSVDTIRFYEKLGLLSSDHFRRETNGYRDYSETAVQRLLLIRYGQQAGFTLNQMREGISPWENDEFTDSQREDLLLSNIEKIDRKIEQLQAMKGYIQSKLERMRGNEVGDSEKRWFSAENLGSRSLPGMNRSGT